MIITKILLGICLIVLVLQQIQIHLIKKFIDTQMGINESNIDLWMKQQDVEKTNIKLFNNLSDRITLVKNTVVALAKIMTNNEIDISEDPEEKNDEST